MGSKGEQKLKIRFAGQGDVPLILGFIRKLAEYERRAHEVTATEEILRKNLFGDKRTAEVIIAEHGEMAVGFALFFHNFSTFLGKPGVYIEDLYIDDRYRGNGFGRAMFTYIAKLAKRRGCGRLEWAVLDWNEPAIKFYRSMGAIPLEEWTVYRMTGEALDSLSKGIDFGHLE